MISIIICSRGSDVPNELRHSIESTIGCDYELVIIDNSARKYTIFEAYNEGVRRSNGDILCFCHDDILFRSMQWGPALYCIFNDESIGQIGIAGTHFIPDAPMYWWSSPFISQYNIENDKGVVKKNDTRYYFHNHLSDVVAVDGVCFFIPKPLFSSIRFDDSIFNGFHAYDMDISMQVQNIGKRVCVTDVLVIEHFWSEDSFYNREYMNKLDANLNKFYQKWRDRLPIVRGLNEPPIVIERLNNLCVQAYDATRARKSKAYKIGRMLLTPFKLFKKKHNDS